MYQDSIGSSSGRNKLSSQGAAKITFRLQVPLGELKQYGYELNKDMQCGQVKDPPFVCKCHMVI